MIARFVMALAIIGLCCSARAVTLGHVDDFQDGTLDNWGGGDTLANVATGGPAGAGDKYLSATSSGSSGSGSKLATTNSASAWAGDYNAAGVTGVSVDLMDLGASPLTMRFVLIDTNGTRWTSLVAASIPTDGLWHHELFSLGQADLMRVLGSDAYATTISTVSQVLIRYDTTPTSGGTTFTGSVGIDNVTTTTVPEPVGSTILVVAAGWQLLRRRHGPRIPNGA